MRAVTVLVFGLCAFAGVWEAVEGGGMSLAQLKNAGKMLRNACGPKSGAAKESLAKLSEGVLVHDDPKLKCYFKCVQQMMQINKKGKYNHEAAQAMIEKTTMLNAETKEKLLKGMVLCKHLDTSIEACELAYQVVKCGFENDEEFFFP